MITKLTTHGNGPYAYSDQDEVQQWEATQWLIEYVQDSNDNNDASWSDWSDPGPIISTYEPAVGEETGGIDVVRS